MDKPTLIIQNICFKKIFELEHQNLEFVIYNDIIKFSTTPAKQNLENLKNIIFVNPYRDRKG